MKTQKQKFLIRGIIYDLIGMVTYAIPGIGPFLDILWAPFAAKEMKQMYSGKEGTIAAVVVFIEELLPFTDAVPTFTLMWLYTFVWKKKPSKERIIDAEVVSGNK